MKHIREDGKYVCPVCGEKFTHSLNLKCHIIKKHEIKEVKEKGIKRDQVLGGMIKRGNDKDPATDFEEVKNRKAIYSCVKVSEEIFQTIQDVQHHCPFLFQLMVSGMETG